MMTKLGYQWTLSIPQHSELGPGLLMKLIRQAGLTVEEFNDLLSDIGHLSLLSNDDMRINTIAHMIFTALCLSNISTPILFIHFLFIHFEKNKAEYSTLAHSRCAPRLLPLYYSKINFMDYRQKETAQG